MTILYSKNGCGKCIGTKMALKREGIEFEERNIEENPSYYVEAKTYGITNMPIVVPEKETGIDPWGDFQVENIRALADFYK